MGTTLLLAEKEYFEDEKVAKAARKADTEECKWRADEANLPGVARASKCAAVSSNTQAMKSGPSNRLVHLFVSESNDRVEEDANGLSEGESDREEGERTCPNTFGACRQSGSLAGGGDQREVIGISYNFWQVAKEGPRPSNQLPD